MTREVVEQRGGRLVAIVREPPPDERELPPVRLELVLRADLRCVVGQLALVARERLLELFRHADERAVRRELDGERAHAVAVALARERARARPRLFDRRGAGRRVAVHVAADPRAEAKRRRRVREPPPPLVAADTSAASKRLCSKNQRPLRISSEIRRRSWRTSSVCQSSVTSSASRSSTSRALRPASAADRRDGRARRRCARARAGPCAGSPPSGAR